MKPVTVFEVVGHDGRARLATIRRDEAIAFAQSAYRSTRVAPDILESERMPVSHRCAINGAHKHHRGAP